MNPKTIQGLYVYLSCNIMSIENSESLNCINIKSDNTDYLFNTLKNGQLSISKNSSHENSIDIPIKRIGKHINIYSVFAKINKAIRHNYEKMNYRDNFGNMSITLS